MSIINKNVMNMIPTVVSLKISFKMIIFVMLQITNRMQKVMPARINQVQIRIHLIFHKLLNIFFRLGNMFNMFSLIVGKMQGKQSFLLTLAIRRKSMQQCIVGIREQSINRFLELIMLSGLITLTIQRKILLHRVYMEANQLIFSHILTASTRIISIIASIITSDVDKFEEGVKKQRQEQFISIWCAIKHNKHKRQQASNRADLKYCLHSKIINQPSQLLCHIIKRNKLLIISINIQIRESLFRFLIIYPTTFFCFGMIWRIQKQLFDFTIFLLRVNMATSLIFPELFHHLSLLILYFNLANNNSCLYYSLQLTINTQKIMFENMSEVNNLQGSAPVDISISEQLDSTINSLMRIKERIGNGEKFDKIQDDNYNKINRVLKIVADKVMSLQFEEYKQKIKAYLQIGREQNNKQVLGIVNYYNKMKASYEHQMEQMRDEIKRQYKVIALMKQEVEDLMIMLNFNSQYHQKSKSESLANDPISEEESNETPRKNINDNFRICLDNLVLEVIEEETERTIISSSRSSSRQRYTQHEFQNQQENYESTGLQAEQKQGRMEKEEEFQQKNSERETDETFRKNKLQNNQNNNKVCQEAQPDNNCIDQANTIYSEKKHMASIFCFQEQQQNLEKNKNNCNLIAINELNMENTDSEAHPDKSLFFQADEEKNDEAIQKYNSYMTHHKGYSLDKIKYISHSKQRSQSEQLEQRHKISEVISYPSESQNFEQFYQSNQLSQDSRSFQTTQTYVQNIDKQRYFQSHGKPRQDKQWESLSERIGLEIQQRSQKHGDSMKKFETQQSAEFNEQREKNQPKTKQFLEQFRKTFNKCLNSMHVAKKHSTKTNSKHATNRSCSSAQKQQSLGHITFGKISSSVSLQNTRPMEIKMYKKEIIDSQKPSNFINSQGKQNRQNSKSLDHMLKQLQSSNKFLIGNKKLQLKYQGGKINSIRSGNGLLYYSNGLTYQGEFKNGYRHGYGILKFNHIQIYNGQWVQDEIEGKGKIRNCAIINKKKSLYSNSSAQISGLHLQKWISYCGEFKNSKFEGSGTLYLQGGEKFIGKFKNGNACGEGAIYRKNGQVEYGLWKNNILIKGQ